MNSIESQFVPYELAVNLKDLGFDWECLGYYGINEDNGSIDILNHCQWSNCGFSHEDTGVQTILYSQAFDWFRVEHGLESFITPVLDADPSIHQYSFIICSFGMEMDEFSQQLDEGDFDTYESARLACLEKLIELVT